MQTPFCDAAVAKSPLCSSTESTKTVCGREKSNSEKLDSKIELVLLVLKKKKPETEYKETTSDCVRI
jgi:hypothetical protein